jgi:hypothetical protein
VTLAPEAIVGIGTRQTSAKDDEKPHELPARTRSLA